MSLFVVETHLEYRPFFFHKVNKAFKYSKIISTRLVFLEKKKLEALDCIDKVNDLRSALIKVKDINKRKKILSGLNYYRKQCNVSRFDIIKDVKELYKPYKAYITSQMAQAIAKRVDAAVSKYVLDNSVEFSAAKVANSIESESITNGIKFDGKNVIYNDIAVPIKVRKDSYFNKAISESNLKYIRIVKRVGKTKTYLVAQFVFNGEAKSKQGISLGNGDVGIDLGTSTIAYCSENEVRIEEFSKDLISTDSKIALINKELDRVRRANNPENFNSDGTIKKKEERIPWKRTHNYKRLLHQLRYFHVKFVNQRKNLYEHQVNNLISKGSRFILEPMDYTELVKRSKESKVDEKGRHLNKSRYGKSILKHAPSTFTSILKRKLSYLKLDVTLVDSYTFKASQYDHIKDEYTKCDLDVRFKEIGGNKVQRDLYSAFLLMNANEDLKTTNKEKCSERFDRFLTLHEIEIKRLKTQSNISCIGV